MKNLYECEARVPHLLVFSVSAPRIAVDVLRAKRSNSLSPVQAPTPSAYYWLLCREQIPTAQVVMHVSDARQASFKDYSWAITQNRIRHQLPGASAAGAKHSTRTLCIVLNFADLLSPTVDSSGSAADNYEHLVNWRDEVTKLKEAGVRVGVFLTSATASSFEKEEEVIKSKPQLAELVAMFKWRIGIRAMSQYALLLPYLPCCV